MATHVTINRHSAPPDYPGTDESTGRATTVARVGDLTLDLIHGDAWRAGRPLALTIREHIVLAYLMCHSGRVVTAAQINRHLWGHASGFPDVADLTIRAPCAKIDQDDTAPLIRAIHGVGYLIEDAG